MGAAVWKELDTDEKKLIQKYNARVKHNENYKEVKFPEGVTVIHKARRSQENSKLEENENTTKQEPINKKIKKEGKGKWKWKGIRFNLKNDHEEWLPEPDGKKKIRNIKNVKEKNTNNIMVIDSCGGL